MLNPQKSFGAGLVAVSLLLSSLTLASAQNNTGVTVGLYDENIYESNAVDFNATTLTATAFGSNVATAFSNNRGGVINFDNISVNGGSGAITATFGAAQSKTLTLGFSDTNLSQYNIQNASTNVAPLSGNSGNPVGNYFIPLFPGGGATTSNSFTLTFGVLTGEAVTQTGFTLLGRNNNPGGTGVVTATFSDSTTASASKTYSMTGRGTEDTFFGFTAPTGLSIQSLTVSFTGGAGRPIDDLGFITTAVPEPSTYLHGAGLVALTLLAGLRQLRVRRAV